MNELEERLRRAVLVEESTEHAMRMDNLFDTASGASGFAHRPVALWKCAAACALCVGMGFALSAARGNEEAASAHAAQPEPAAPSERVEARPAPEGRFVVGDVVTREDGWIEATVEIIQP